MSALRLREQQQRFKAVLLHRSTGDAAAIDVADRPPISMARRLEVYRYAYIARLEECVADDFPKLKKTLGKKRFWALIEDYLRAFPSRSFNISEAGSSLAQFMDQNPKWKIRPHLGDLARFEWAKTEAFLAADKLSGNVPSVDGAILLSINPTAQFLVSKWQVHKAGRPQLTRLVVFLGTQNVEWRELSVAEYAILQEIHSPVHLAKLAEALGPLRVSPEIAQTWFKEWSAKGLVVLNKENSHETH